MPTRNELGREAVSALATAVVVVLGTIALVFVIVVGTEQPEPYLAGLATIVLVSSLLMFLLRSRSATTHSKRQPWWKMLRNKQHPPEPKLVVKRRKDPGHDNNTEQPPTAETLRDLKEHGSTWVPNRLADRH